MQKRVLLSTFVQNSIKVMIQNERDIRFELAIQAAQQMMVAARTAPKGKGVDIIEMALVSGEDKIRLADEMERIGIERGYKFFNRDAENVLKANIVMIIGTRQKTQSLNCSHCGFHTCQSKPAAIPCAINTIDVGIAVGSACAKAADLRVDTRVMFSAGFAAQSLSMLGDDCGCVMGIPISASSKSPFFDRKD